jgi:tetratricopeptide (TPR) repeat protein
VEIVLLNIGVEKMADDEWFRNSRWELEDQNAFFERLSRSRGNNNKAQYARIKALSLARSGNKYLVIGAKDLLKRIIQEWPDRSELASCYLQLAECEELLGNLESTVDWYRKSLQQEKIYPNVRTMAWTQFPLFVVKNHLRKHYGESLKILSEFEPDFTFPKDQFVVFAVRSLIASENGDHQNARENAEKALQLAGVKDSGLRYHPKVGLVEDQQEIINRLEKILH